MLSNPFGLNIAGWGPFRLPGEKRRMRIALERARGIAGLSGLLNERDQLREENDRLHEALNNAIEALREVYQTHTWRPWDQAAREKALARAQLVYETRGRDSGGE